MVSLRPRSYCYFYIKLLGCATVFSLNWEKALSQFRLCSLFSACLLYLQPELGEGPVGIVAFVFIPIFLCDTTSSTCARWIPLTFWPLDATVDWPYSFITGERGLLSLSNYTYCTSVFSVHAEFDACVCIELKSLTSLILFLFPLLASSITFDLSKFSRLLL
jgi:hypothetical protein